MRNLVAAGAALALASGAFAAEMIEGNWYSLDEVKKLSYDFTPAGSYMEVTSMDVNTGKCEQRKKEYNSPIGPFAEEVAMVIRGPIQWSQFAVYYPGTAPAKIKRRHMTAHQRRHGHQHFHKRNEEIRQLQQRSVGESVTATINGEVVTFANEYSGGATPPPDSGSSGSSDAAPPPSSSADPSPSKDGSPSSSPSEDGDSGDAPATGDWTRTAYYNADTQTAEGLAFLNNRGHFDYTFGNGLSYASSDGKTKADSPQILEKDLTLPSTTEVLIFSDKKCEGDSCGFYRPNTVAHHGFGGEEKAFLMEFKMPYDGKRGNKFEAPDMSAIWMLNANIPRTGQYLSAECTCWKSGCGEFDLFEVLDPGNFRCKSTVHAKDGIGHPEWFRRPVDKMMKAAVVFTGGKGYIKVLDDNFDFPSAFSNADLKGLID